MQNAHSTCTKTNAVIVGWLDRGNNRTNVHTQICIHTQLLTSWSSLVLSWEFVRLLDSRAAASSWFRLYFVHTCIRERTKEKKKKKKQRRGIKCSGRSQTKNTWEEEKNSNVNYQHGGWQYNLYKWCKNVFSMRCEVNNLNKSWWLNWLMEQVES